jgi:TetR/AcrR family transcriptional regulator, regulator of cefoperazone and chloramphenicol sensitivity
MVSPPPPPPPPPPPLSVQQTSDTRLALLDAAEALFSERGYGGVSTREIVEQAGANIAAIRYHFGSKEELYKAVLQRAIERSECDDVWSVLPLSGGPVSVDEAAAGLARFIDAFLLQVVNEASQDTAPSLVCREAAEPSGALPEMIEQYFKPRIEQIEGLITVLRPSAKGDELRALGQAVFGQVLQYKSFFEIQALLWLGRTPDAKRLHTIAKSLAGFTLRGLGCEDAVVEKALMRIGQAEEHNR